MGEFVGESVSAVLCAACCVCALRSSVCDCVRRVEGNCIRCLVNLFRTALGSGVALRRPQSVKIFLAALAVSYWHTVTMWKQAIAADAEMAAMDAERADLEARAAAMTKRVNECDSFMKKSELRDELNVLRKELAKVRQEMHTRGSALQRSSKLASMRLAAAAATTTTTTAATAAASSIVNSNADAGPAGASANSPALEATVVAPRPSASCIIERHFDDGGLESEPEPIELGNNDQTIVAPRSPRALGGSTKLGATTENGATAAGAEDGAIRFFNDTSEMAPDASLHCDAGNADSGGTANTASVTNSPYEDELAQTMILLAPNNKGVKPVGSSVSATDVATTAAASDFFTGSEFAQSHNTVQAVLEARVKKLQLLRKFWAAGDVEAILSYLQANQDASVTADFLRSLNVRALEDFEGSFDVEGLCGNSRLCMCCFDQCARCCVACGRCSNRRNSA